MYFKTFIKVNAIVMVNYLITRRGKVMFFSLSKSSFVSLLVVLFILLVFKYFVDNDKKWAIFFSRNREFFLPQVSKIKQHSSSALWVISQLDDIRRTVSIVSELYIILFYRHFYSFKLNNTVLLMSTCRFFQDFVI